MKVILYMTITANGMIAKEDGSVEWTSEGTWNSYSRFCKEKGNLIVGRKTYNIMPVDEFVENCLYVVMTNKGDLPKKIENVIFTDKNPKEVVGMLKEKGFDEICVGGGSMIDSVFMKENLVDEIYLDIEPVLLGRGIKLFADEDFEAKLELIDIKKLSENEVQLHYRVVKWGYGQV